MKKLIVFLLVLTIMLLSSCMSTQKSWKEPPFKVEIKDGTIYYSGTISIENYEYFLKVIDEHEGEPLYKLVIDSPGGDTVVGRQIGEFVFEQNLDVEVSNLCFSSCANYVFPAGKNKIIQDKAIVGWHGSEHQGLIISKRNNQTAEEYERNELEIALLEAYPDLSEDELNGIINAEIERLYQTREDEKVFFKKINTSIYLTLYGIINGFPREGEVHSGWTYSIEDMEKFGVKNITYLGENNYPDKAALISKGIYTEKATDMSILEEELEM